MSKNRSKNISAVASSSTANIAIAFDESQKRYVDTLQTKLNQALLREQNVKMSLSKLDGIFTMSDEGGFNKPSWVTVVLNWKKILDIILDIIAALFNEPAKDRMYWEK